NIHTTSYSTTAIESLYFGLPNVLVDFGFGENMISDLNLTDGKSSTLVRSSKEYISLVSHIVNNIEEYSSYARTRSSYFFEPEAHKNIQKFLNMLNM
ncbi:MAG: hypothetical protein GWP10_21715, partial [Nitrospiraceae bacterium]|nr:hypothetical protein [Nitrospiraceae bacterium]